MAGRAGAFLFAAILMGMTFTGCLGGGGEVDAAAVTPTVNDSGNVTTELPTGEECKACKEVNVTEEGVGGMDHEHDYWNGQENVVIYDADVEPFFLPIGERDDTSKFFIGFINLENVPGSEDRPALVFEGTGLVTFTITQAPAWSDTFDVVYRTAATDWSSPVPLKVGEPFAYEPEKTETDMPHSMRSLWNWKIYATGPLPVTGDPAGWFDAAQSPIHVTISVQKARSVDDWPGHPDFYAGVSERVVMEELKGQTTVQQAGDVLLYGVEPDQLVPDKLVSMGTHTLDVHVNITSLTMPPGVQPDGFYLFWRSAATRPDSLGYGQANNETDGITYAYFHLQLDPEELDSPYQPGSRFSFKLLANPANSDVAYCYRCMPYEIHYTMTIIARPLPPAAAEPAAGGAA